MRKIFVSILLLILTAAITGAQTLPQSKPQQQETGTEDIVRISTALVQTDVVVTDKNDQIIPDLKREDFELYENGRKQDIKFMEFVSVNTGRRTEGERPTALPAGAEIPRDLTAGELKRVIAFVVDDLTIPFEDMPTVRKMLTDFVNNEMREGDLVAIVRTVGGKGLLQQFTSDKQLLRRAIAALNVTTNPFMAFNNPAAERLTSAPATPTSESGGEMADIGAEEMGAANLSDPNDDVQRLFRGLMSLTTANFVVDSLKEIPGRKSLVLVSGGIPIFDVSSTGSVYSNVTYLLNHLADNAARAGVVINTMDPRGLKASTGVASFTTTPAKSALGAEDPTFGRGGGSDEIFGPPLAGAAEHLGLETVANATGGVNVVNTNNFKAGLDRVLARSSGYYLLAYTPAEKFDNKFRKIEIKVKRANTKVYSHSGYIARETREANAPTTKEGVIAAAAKSPLARRDIDISANVILKPSPARNTGALGVHLLIDANKLNFTQTTDGKYQASFDVVGFIYDQLGKLRGGFSETVNTSLTPDDYKKALKTGLTYSANTELPPGYFQVRAAVREASTGNLGTISRYVEIPDLTKGRLTMSSIFLASVDPAQTKATPEQLLASRQISRKQELRYAALVYNAKASSGKTQLRSKMIISQGSKVLYEEPEEPLEAAATSPATKAGQLGLSKVSPGHYVLTVVVTDPLADKKNQTVARSIDFTVVP